VFGFEPEEVQMRKWLALLVACGALGFVVAGCGGDDDNGGGGGGGGGGTQKPAESGGGGGGSNAQVSMKNIQFNPKDVTIKSGGTVTWTNDEAVAHDVDGSGQGVKFSSGPTGGMNEGDTFKFTFDKPGTYKYVCRVHAPGMSGTVTVK
jgi:plastocyanin